MNQIGLYVATVLLLTFYSMLISGTVRLARMTSIPDSDATVADYLFGANTDEDKGIFYIISIGFPFLITVLPWLIDGPKFDTDIGRFLALVGLISNYLVVIITVEVGLMYAVTTAEKKWRNRLLVVIILDLINYIFLALTKAKIDLTERLANMPSTNALAAVPHFEISGYSFALFSLTGFASFFASLVIVLAVSKLGGPR